MAQAQQRSVAEGAAGVSLEERPDGGGLQDRRAMDRQFGVYAILSSTALAFAHRPSTWPLIAALHLTAAGLAAGLGPFARVTGTLRRRLPGVTELLHDWYPLILMPLLYTELATLNLAVWGGRYFDPVILSVEQAVFHAQPSRMLWQRFPYLPLSELLHSAYLSYYLIIYVPPIVLYAMGRRGDFRRLVFPLMLTYFVHYLVFVYFPVQGPRYLFPAPGGALARGPVYRLAHHILESGSSRGAAFPSSHVAVSTAQALLVRRFLPRLFPYVAVAALLLAVGTVYGGFHYATDACVGFLMGILLVLLAPRVKRLLLARSGASA